MEDGGRRRGARVQIRRTLEALESELRGPRAGSLGPPASSVQRPASRVPVPSAFRLRPMGHGSIGISKLLSQSSRPRPRFESVVAWQVNLAQRPFVKSLQIFACRRSWSHLHTCAAPKGQDSKFLKRPHPVPNPIPIGRPGCVLNVCAYVCIRLNVECSDKVPSPRPSGVGYGCQHSTRLKASCIRHQVQKGCCRFRTNVGF